MFKLIIGVFIFASSLLVLACNKPIEYPIEPVLTFGTINTLKFAEPVGNITDSIEVVIDFTDGDGDLGLPDGVDGDSTNYNLFYTSYLKRNGTWTIIKPVPPFNVITSYHIPTLNKSKKSRPIKGKIKVDVTAAYSFFATKDTIRLEMYVKDNAGHKSNTITTSEHIGLQ